MINYVGSIIIKLILLLIMLVALMYIMLSLYISSNNVNSILSWRIGIVYHTHNNNAINLLI